MRRLSPRILNVLFVLLVGGLATSLVACGGGDEGDGGAATEEEGSEDAGAEGEGTAETTIVATEYKFDLPATMPAGETTFTLANEGKEQHFIEIVELKEDAPPVDKLVKMRDAQKFFVRQAGNTPPVKPGEESQPFDVDLTPGRYGYVCFIQAPNGKPHAFLGMAGEFTVE